MAIEVQSPPESSVAVSGNGVAVEDVQRLSEPSVTSLVSGIIADAQRLFQQQVAMFRQEVRDDFRKTKQAGTTVAAGVGLSQVGCILLGVMVSLLLHWAMPDLPLWVCCGIVGGVLAVLGWALICVGVKKFESFNPLPDQSAEALMENLKWKTNPK